MNNKDLINDRIRLVKLIDSTPDHKITGRITLQKMVYLIQQFSKKLGSEKTFNYKFKYYNFGPFDKNVGIDATWLSNETGLIFEKEPEIDQNSSWEYVSFLSDDLKAELPSSDELFGIPETEYQAIVNELIGHEPKTLEMASTIVYINNNNIVKPEKIKILAIELKPHLKDRYDQALGLAKNFML